MVLQQDVQKIDYLLIGHITKDKTKNGYRIGGTATYSSILAKRMGLRVGLVTSYEIDFPVTSLAGIQIINQPTQNTTTFENIYTESGRAQYLLGRAEKLDINLIPQKWLSAKIVHLGPVVDEVNLEIAANFPQSMVGLSLQGWLRKWDQEGFVQPTALPENNKPMPKNTIGFLSLEDINGDRDYLEILRQLFPILILTKGKDGTEIYKQDQIIEIPAKSVIELDPTGAGDVFAAGLLISHIIKKNDLVESTCIATELAGISVTRPGIEGIPTRQEINTSFKTK
jgi:sugar/nucleoside kinase (ribokinase family)